ncbi:MAG: hypothetical protein KME27_11295 [Lyngbya sp. HA4199-MV5]|nr:hypothetical protein [Lyngbya sp. HA4199-MV5]
MHEAQLRCNVLVRTKSFILQHRDDLDALEAFFARRSPDSEATWFTPPKTEEEWQQQLEVIRPILERKSSKDNSKATVIKGTIKVKSTDYLIRDP